MIFTGLSYHILTGLSYHFLQGFRMIFTVLSYRILTGLSYHFLQGFCMIFTGLSYRFGRTFILLLQGHRNLETISVISSEMLLTRFRIEISILSEL
jgi:hypothetical protein